MTKNKVGNIGALVLAGIATIASGCARDMQEPKPENYKEASVLAVNPNYDLGGNYHITRDDNGKIIRFSQVDDHSGGWCFYSKGHENQCRNVRNVQLDQGTIEAIEDALNATNRILFHIDSLRYAEFQKEKESRK